MPLPLEGPRPLSPLEREAVELVFWDSIDPCDVYLTVLEELRGHAATYGGQGQININKKKFERTDALHVNSTSADPRILEPGNIKYLSSLIHECTHYWQAFYERYQWCGPSKQVPYEFTRSELTGLPPSRKWWNLNPRTNKDLDMLNLLKEQHASAAQVYFIIAWQLKHLPKGSDVNLSHRRAPKNPPPNYVGSVHRYDEIFKLDDDNDGRLFVSRDVAEDLAYHFSAYLVELRSGGRKQWAG